MLGVGSVYVNHFIGTYKGGLGVCTASGHLLQV